MSEILETGDVYFAYRPRVEETAPEDLEDVQRFFLVLQPSHGNVTRLLVVGRKRLPETEPGHGRFWGFVDRVAQDPEAVEDALDPARYETETRGVRDVGAARPVGEGVYAIVAHEDHTHLAYALELPEAPAEVQEAFRLDEEASYVLSVKNPETASPGGAGLEPEARARFPEALQTRFEGRRFIPVNPPDFLDHEGAEVLLIGASGDAEQELEITLDEHDESLETAEIFDRLQMEREKHPLQPLTKGRWQ